MNELERAAAEHGRVLAESVPALSGAFDAVAAAMATALRGGHRVLACGNGGSAADAQHFVAELVGRFRVERAALPAVALSADTALLTAVANDSGFDQVFSRQVDALGRDGDVLLAISTSGRSPNVVQAARAARRRGMIVVALTGRGGGDLAAGDLVDHSVAVPSDVVARIQEVHGIFLHALAELIERQVSDGEWQPGG